MTIKIHENIFGRKHDAKRDYSDKEGRSARPWRRKRKRILIRDKYTCQICKCISHDLEVDHKLPLHKGGTDDDSNLQSLCSLCHNMKSASERGINVASMFPEWMPKIKEPSLMVVCGRPASGKSTYVRLNAGKHDTIIDLSLMASEMKRKLYDLSKEERYALIRVRNNRIAAYIRGETSYHKCWIITTASTPDQRNYWKERGAYVIVMETPADVCERRINAEDIPTWHKVQRLEAVKTWVD